MIDQIRAWSEDLINLNRNNRLLYYRKTKSSTLELKLPSANDLLERLSSDKGVMFWEPLEEPSLDIPDASKELFETTLTALVGDEFGHDRSQTRKKRVIPSYGDDIVCDVATRELLLKSLRWLERRAAQEFMDKGIWILYLAVGILDWIEPPRETGEAESVSSPIVLIPVQLRRDSAQAPFQLFRAEEDSAINPALAFKLQHDFGISLPSFEDEDEENIDIFLESIRDVCADQEGWNVRDTVVLSIFSFHKEAMYRDLHNNEDAVAAHPLVQGLALGHRGERSLTFDPIPESELDEEHPPESTISILDCDASQRQCLAAAAVGQSFVMEGPPGTGKSQTIANLIADALGHGKTVLFVSEKAAALEVVQTRLDHAGLSEFVLELHSHKATRKQVAQSLGRSLKTRIVPRDRIPDVELHRLIAHRRELTAFAMAMNERRESLGKSVHMVIGELSAIQHLSQAPACDSIDSNLSAVQFAKICDSAEALSRSWGPVARGDDFLWRSLVEGVLTQGRRAALLTALDRAVEVVDAMKLDTITLAEESGLPWQVSVLDTRSFHDLLLILATPRKVPTGWLSMKSLQPLRTRLEILAAAAETYNRLIEQLAMAVGSRWRELSHDDLPIVQESRAFLEKSPLGFVNATFDGRLSAVALKNSLRNFISLLRRGMETADELADALEAPVPQTTAELRSLFELATLVSSPHKPAAAWLDSANLPRVCAAVDALEPLVKNVRVSLAAVETLFRPSILNTDVDAMHYRFTHIHKGFAKVRPAYWRDKRSVRVHTKSNRVRHAELSGLQSAVACKRNQSELRAGEEQWAKSIGSAYYRSLDSDFKSIRSALDTASAVLRLSGGKIGQAILARRFSTDADQTEVVVRALPRLEQWFNELEKVSERLGPPLGRLIFERPFSELLTHCDAAVAEAERLAEALTRIASIFEAEEISVNTVVECLIARIRAGEIESEFARDSQSDGSLIGPDYIGPATDFGELMKDLNWSEQLRDLVGPALPTATAEQILQVDTLKFESIGILLEEWSQLEANLLEQFAQEHRSEVRPELQTPFDETKTFLGALIESIDDISEWDRHANAVKQLRDLGLEKAVGFCIQKRLPAADINAVLRRSALESWVDSIRKNDSRLHKFTSDDRNHFTQAFRDLDRRFVEVAASRVVETCNAKRPTMGAGAVGLIASEANKQKRHMPIRRLIEQAAAVVQALKPCMMMSPLSVSQFLSPTMSFDLVIFDEASQVRPADAINCIYRGKQLVIAGDQKQLPPTPFFDKIDSDSGDEWAEDQLDEYESVLDVAKGAGAFRSMSLRWHYRSQHEDLITYSNYSFYGGELVTFPSANIKGADLGVELFVVPGVYRRGGARDNPIEAASVVERVLFHVREHPHLSIGVVAFSEAQASTIENEILRRSEQNPELRVMLDGDRLHGGFVKNLESVQGDERDIIIFSIGYGRDEAGRFTLNFGPLNKNGGHRRLNVAITRARRRVEIVSSIEASDFVGDLRSDGVRHLRRYLDFAARTDNRLAALAGDLSTDGRDTESPFEEEVLRIVRSWGYEVVPQVGCADYRIDLAVKHPGYPGRYALGIECDGAMYHSSRVARDRDRLRQEVLSRLGWTNLHRIWGLSWYWSRGKEELRLRQAIERAIAGQPNVSPIVRTDVPKVAEFTIELTEIPEWVVPYRVATPRRPGSDLEIHDSAAQSDLQRMISEVVRGEGPVAVEVVLRRVREQWGMSRAGSRARSAFDTAVRTLSRKGEIASHSDGFLALPGQPIPVVRAGDKDNPETIRSIHEIPPSELREAIVRFVRDVHSITEDELTARVSLVFGWNRRGSDIASEFRKIVRNLVSADVVRRSGDVLTVPSNTERS